MNKLTKGIVSAGLALGIVVGGAAMGASAQNRGFTVNCPQGSHPVIYVSANNPGAYTVVRRVNSSGTTDATKSGYGSWSGNFTGVQSSNFVIEYNPGNTTFWSVCANN